MNDQLTVGSLFAGIGGFDLGLERAGMRTLWLCEQDPFCQRVLARHWPGVPCHPDVRALVADTGTQRRNGWPRLNGTGRHPGLGGETGDHPGDSRDPRGEGLVPVPVPYVDVLCGGFPCQDISLAGRGAGLAGERSGLWREFARLIGELRPRYVIVENVPALTSRGLDIVLADLAACGFDAEWDHLPASAFGAPHRRDRIWLVAYPGGDDGGPGRPRGPAPGGARQPVAVGALQDAADPERPRLEGHGADAGRTQEPGPRNGRAFPDANGESEHGRTVDDEVGGTPELLGDADQERRNRRPRQQRPRRRGEPADAGWWLIEPDVGRVAHGVPARVHRLRALGNSLVPQIAEWIGGQIIEWERQSIGAPVPC